MQIFWESYHKKWIYHIFVAKQFYDHIYITGKKFTSIKQTEGIFLKSVPIYLFGASIEKQIILRQNKGKYHLISTTLKCENECIAHS